MAECVRNYFMLNDELISAADFNIHYHPGKEYIYEVFRVQEGIPLFIEHHLQRLKETLRLNSVDFDFLPEVMLKSILKVINANPPGSGNIKIVYYLGHQRSPNLFIYFVEHSYPTKEEQICGVEVALLFAERKNPNAKVMDTFLRAQTDEWKVKTNVYEVLLVTHKGFITEGSRSNVFFIKDNYLITAPSNTVLEGITRKQIIEICNENNIAVEEKLVNYKKLNEFDALFLSGTSRRVLPINKVDEVTFETNHPLLKKLNLLFEEKVKLYIEEFKIN